MNRFQTRFTSRDKPLEKTNTAQFINAYDDSLNLKKVILSGFKMKITFNDNNRILNTIKIKNPLTILKIWKPKYSDTSFSLKKRVNLSLYYGTNFYTLKLPLA